MKKLVENIRSDKWKREEWALEDATAECGPGHWHVWVRDGSISFRRMVLPNRPKVAVAIEEAREAMLAALHKANASRPIMSTPTPKEMRAVAAYRAVMGSETALTFMGISMNDLVDAGIKALVTKWKRSYKRDYKPRDERRKRKLRP